MNLINFDPDGMQEAIMAAAAEGFRSFGESLVAKLREAVQGLPLKSSKDGGDIEHLAGWLESIQMTYLDILSDEISMGVSSGASDEEDSFIGVYYEYGTGRYAEGEDSTMLYGNGVPGGWNPGRPGGMGSQIVGRAEPGLKPGQVFDYVTLGGTVRQSTGLFAYIMNSDVGKRAFMDYVGGDSTDSVGAVEAYHWFSNTITENADELSESILEAIARDLDFLNFLSGNSIEIDA